MIRVALIDDHPLILKIVRQELSRELDLQIIWDSQDSGETMAAVARQTPDVLVLDLSFSGQAFEPVAAVRATIPSLPALLGKNNPRNDVLAAGNLAVISGCLRDSLFVRQVY